MSAKPPQMDGGYRSIDHRLNIFECDSQEVKNNSALIGAWIFAENLEKNDASGAYRLKKPLKKLKDKYAPLSASEKFPNELVIADLTGFVVGKKLVATAAHCFTMPMSDNLDKIDRIAKLRFVLGCESFITT